MVPPGDLPGKALGCGPGHSREVTTFSDFCWEEPGPHRTLAKKDPCDYHQAPGNKAQLTEENLQVQIPRLNFELAPSPFSCCGFL